MKYNLVVEDMGDVLDHVRDHLRCVEKRCIHATSTMAQEQNEHAKTKKRLNELLGALDNCASIAEVRERVAHFRSHKL